MNIFSDLHQLTPRETDILEYLLNGYCDSETIADKLGISINTVRIHARHLLKKAGAASRVEVVVKYLHFHVQYVST